MISRFAFVSALGAGLMFAQGDDWTKEFPAHKVAGNVYYVGSEGLAAYLITTPQGHFLINSNLESSVPQIQKSVESLGFKFKDIKFLLINHAHWDHCAGSKKIKELTGATYAVMAQDVPVIEQGGKNDFQYGSDSKTWYPAVKVDRVLKDGDSLSLGGTTLTAHLTAGHTKGCTTWTLKVKEGAKTYDAVIVGSPNVNNGYKLVKNDKYPGIAQDYEREFVKLNSLPCDLFLGAHGAYYGLAGKFARLKQNAANPFLDPAGYRSYILDRQRAFETELRKQTGK